MAMIGCREVGIDEPKNCKKLIIYFDRASSAEGGMIDRRLINSFLMACGFESTCHAGIQEFRRVCVNRESWSYKAK
jgi:hypothetical protein